MVIFYMISKSRIRTAPEETRERSTEMQKVSRQ
jgi:hypothetical protein